MTLSPCQGWVEEYVAGALTGWIYRPGAGGAPLLLLALVDGVARGACLANLYRGDLVSAGVGETGYHGFRLTMALAPGETVQLVDPQDGVPLLSPFTRPLIMLDPTAPTERADCRFGNIDTNVGTSIDGWCWNPAAPEKHLTVMALVEGVVVQETVAGKQRGDLVEAGIGEGDHAFTLDMPFWMLDGRKRLVHVHAEGIGLLNNSPVSFQSTARGPQHLLAQLAAAVPPERQEELEGTRQLLAAFLAENNVIHPRSIGFARYEEWLAAMQMDLPPNPTPQLRWPLEGPTPEDTVFRCQAAAGDILFLIDAGVRLLPGALDRALTIFTQTDADLLYTDADMRLPGKPAVPWFRPDWNYDLFLSQDYMRGLVLVRAALLDQAQPLASLPAVKMMATEQARPGKIIHLPEIWASIERQAENQALWLDVVTGHMQRRGFAGGSVALHPRWPDLRRVQWPRPAWQAPLISLIIPTRDRLDLLRPCIDSILTRTRYRPFEIIIIDNQSQEPETLSYLAQGSRQGRFRVLSYDAPFNYADMNNQAAQVAQGTVLGFINNDVELISPDWLGEAVSLLARPEVGAVGARLRFANGMIQHGGVVVGTGGLAENAFQQCHVDDEGYFGRTQVAGNYSAVTAACLFCRKTDFLAVGGFDAQNLPVAFNDVDLCLRLRQQGFLLVWTPAIDLFHYESVSRGRDMAPERRARSMKEEQYMRHRWYHQAMSDPAYNPNLNLDGRPFRGLALPSRHCWGGPLPGVATLSAGQEDAV
ncbi:glycosyltransferase [Niveispirillum sp. SYP-B3756]|uniref:glycosyltransferase family 2 protein n=1 Tax=Niveispirillum sp. SYP-B3756 TaxID=2662178 RepID=UPI001290EA56|nr:glycosyltransferase [Niveispirillum sp. SYP-B3756]MQP64907.1 glycosyltransferase [Niveispirillum sp. SYP-B3756]